VAIRLNQLWFEKTEKRGKNTITPLWIPRIPADTEKHVYNNLMMPNVHNVI